MLKLVVKVISAIALMGLSSSMLVVCSYSSASSIYHSKVSQSDVLVNPYYFLRHTLDSLNAEIKNSQVSYDKSPKKLYKIVKSLQ